MGHHAFLPAGSRNQISAPQKSSSLHTDSGGHAEARPVHFTPIVSAFPVFYLNFTAIGLVSRESDGGRRSWPAPLAAEAARHGAAARALHALLGA
eukprot:4516113-Prymnesium_polylepis.1